MIKVRELSAGRVIEIDRANFIIINDDLSWSKLGSLDCTVGNLVRFGGVLHQVQENSLREIKALVRVITVVKVEVGWTVYNFQGSYSADEIKLLGSVLAVRLVKNWEAITIKGDYAKQQIEALQSFCKLTKVVYSTGRGDYCE